MSKKYSQTKLQGFTVFFDNSEEFHGLKNEVFTQDTYYFETDTVKPVILDVGAHIGLSTLYFKKLYPAAQITCLEPIAENRVLLEKNIFENQLLDVEVKEEALAPTSGKVTLYLDDSALHWFSTASIQQGAWNGQQTSQERQVPAMTLSSLLQERKYDLVKIDIEGLEGEVIQEAAALLSRAEHYFIEFHPGGKGSLPSLVELFEKKGFQVTVYKKGKEVSPYKVSGLVIVEAILS